MAGKIVVTNPEIKGEAGFTKISVESAIQKARASATFSDPSASVSFVQIEAESAYQFAKGLIEWADIKATEMVLDPFSLNHLSYVNTEAAGPSNTRLLVVCTFELAQPV